MVIHACAGTVQLSGVVVPAPAGSGAASTAARASAPATSRIRAWEGRWGSGRMGAPVKDVAAVAGVNKASDHGRHRPRNSFRLTTELEFVRDRRGAYRNSHGRSTRSWARATLRAGT